MALLRREKPRQPISREASLQSRPVRNPAVRAEKAEGGGLVLHAKVEHRGFGRALARVFRVKDLEKRFTLDELGAFVWEMCDGETTVRTLINRFASEFKLNRKEAEVSMVEYLKTLAKKGIIGIAVPEEPRAKGKRSRGGAGRAKEHRKGTP